ncbi:39S ribosomal protein L16, mitochondrial [Vanrija albida]|uniref:39S ribosomal protein L16, mitochondrial n=1 Tax=Vanrija albida TaxID=181172 RepID=A0ABR3PXW2_9TREE
MLGLGSLRTSLGGLLRPTLGAAASAPVASSSRVTLAPAPAFTQVRFRSQLSPRRTKHRKAQKGRVALPTGGSIKGTTLRFGGFGIRLLAAARLTAAQLTASQAAIKRKIKGVKGAQLYLRVFPDIPVCIKGNETRMGKGKGTFEYWACRVPAGRVVMEIAGGGIREEIAKQALKLAQVKMPVASEFIAAGAPPRLGAIADHALAKPAAAQKDTAPRVVATPEVQSFLAAQAAAAQPPAQSTV